MGGRWSSGSSGTAILSGESEGRPARDHGRWRSAARFPHARCLNIPGSTRGPLIAKIEKPQAVDAADEIIRSADCVIATQMLDSMVNSSRPTRAEAADVANAILDGTDAVVLSQETAIGSDPVEAVAMMASVAERTEHTLPYRTPERGSGKETVRRCRLMWGVQAGPIRRHEVTEALIADAAKRVVELGWVKPGARVGITAGLPSGRPGTTSLMQIQRV